MNIGLFSNDDGEDNENVSSYRNEFVFLLLFLNFSCLFQLR